MRRAGSRRILAGCLTSRDEQWRDLPGWLADRRHVALTAEGRAWGAQNALSIHDKHDAYLAKWLAKDAAERPMLRREDGILLQDLPREWAEVYGSARDGAQVL